MADTTAAAATSSLSAQEQARIRRERRQAKMREGGSVRLNRITATQGTSFRRDEPEATPPPAPTVEGEGESHSDPPEVDISLTRPTLSSRPSILQQHAAAHFSSTVSPEDDIRQAMMLDQLYRPRGSSSSSPSGTPSLDEGQDPLMQLLQQISGAGGGLGGMPGMPPGMESMMSGMMGGIGEGVQAAEQKADRSGVWWSILHALGALMISFWTLRASPVVFDGSQLARTESAGLTRSEKPQLFWYFALMELLLQSTRFLLEKGRPPQGSLLTKVAGFLPAPFSTYLSTLARYSVFLWAILADAGVVIFALGIASWWNTGAAQVAAHVQY